MSTLSGKFFLSVAGTDKRKNHVDAGTKIKKVSLRAACQTNMRLTVAEKFVQILDIDFGLVSVAKMNRTAYAIADTQFIDMQAQGAISDESFPRIKAAHAIRIRETEIGSELAGLKEKVFLFTAATEWVVTSEFRVKTHKFSC